MNKKGAIEFEKIVGLIIILLVLVLVVYFVNSKFSLFTGERGLGSAEKSILNNLKDLNFEELTNEEKKKLDEESPRLAEQKKLEQIEGDIKSENYDAAINLADDVINKKISEGGISKAIELKRKAEFTKILNIADFKDRKAALDIFAEKYPNTQEGIEASAKSKDLRYVLEQQDEKEKMKSEKEAVLSEKQKELLMDLRNYYSKAYNSYVAKNYGNAASLFASFITDYDVNEGSFSDELGDELNEKFIYSYDGLISSYLNEGKCDEIRALLIRVTALDKTKSKVKIFSLPGEHSLLAFTYFALADCWDKRGIGSEEYALYYYSLVGEFFKFDSVIYDTVVKDNLKSLILKLAEEPKGCSNYKSQNTCESLKVDFSQIQGGIKDYYEPSIYGLEWNDRDKKRICVWDTIWINECCLGSKFDTKEGCKY